MAKAKTAPKRVLTIPDSATLQTQYEAAFQLATPEHSVPSDYPASMGESRVARLERKLDEALEKLTDAQERLRRIDRRSRHLD